jgi:hypothetical protein
MASRRKGAEAGSTYNDPSCFRPVLKFHQCLAQARLCDGLRHLQRANCVWGLTRKLVGLLELLRIVPSRRRKDLNNIENIFWSSCFDFHAGSYKSNLYCYSGYKIHVQHSRILLGNNSARYTRGRHVVVSLSQTMRKFHMPSYGQPWILLGEPCVVDARNASRI